MSFSRYDQIFLGFITDTSRKVTETALDSAVREVVDIEAEKIDSSIITWTTRVAEHLFPGKIKKYIDKSLYDAYNNT